MIAELRGTLAAKAPDRSIVDVHGIGFEVATSLNTFYALPEPGSPVRLLVHTHVREDALQLFGFLDREEKNLFLMLQSVSGIGPKLALNILSGTPFAALLDALEAGDLGRLVAIPGVGKKTAERLVVELRDKVGKARVDGGASEPSLGRGIEVEAVSALVNLGYRRNEAEKAAKAVLAAGAGDLEEVIRGALKRLSG